MGHALDLAAQEENNWDLEQAVRETEKSFSTDLQLLMTERINDLNLLKTLFAGTPATRTDAGGISVTQKEAIKPVRSGRYRGQNLCPQEPPNNDNEPHCTT